MTTIRNVIRWTGVVVTLAAIAAQMKTLADNGVLNIVNFFSYFTIQSNLIGVAALAASAVIGPPRPRWLDWLRGAAVVYLTVTFIVVIFLLQGVDVGLQLAWVDFALHKLLPLIVVVDFAFDPPKARLSTRDALLWLVFPLIWLAYTLIRGPIAGWYPYPFLDPANGGYSAVGMTSLVVVVAGALLSLAVAWLGNRLAARRDAGV